MQIDKDFESQLLMQFCLSNPILPLFAKEYLYLVTRNVFLIQLGNTASLEPANFEILLEETLKEMMEEAKGCQLHHDLLLLTST